jgi:hypothetical protein
MKTEKKQFVEGAAWDGRVGPLIVAASFAIFLAIVTFNAI